METLYDTIGRGYAAIRKADPRFARAVARGLGDAASVVNVGAGTGAYEPTDRAVIAVEPSTTMIAQRPVGPAPVVRATAMTPAFGRDDLLTVANVADLANTRIYELQNAIEFRNPQDDAHDA